VIFFHPVIIVAHIKPECLSLVSILILVLYLWVRPGTIRVEHHGVLYSVDGSG